MGELTVPARVVPFEGSVGAEIIGLDPFQRPRLTAEVVRGALDRHRVVVIRQEEAPDDDALVAFARHFGPLLPANDSGGDDGRPVEVLAVVTDERTGTPAVGAGWPAAGLPWHHDYSYLPEPGAESFLDPVELPAPGTGATSFLDMAAALDAFDPAQRGRLRQSAVTCRLDTRLASSLAAEPGEVRAPLVIWHPRLRREVLWLGPAFGCIDDLDSDASVAYREELIAHATRHGRCYDHVWHEGDLVVFDNLAVLHQRAPVPSEHRREMRQVSTRCERPLRAGASAPAGQGASPPTAGAEVRTPG